MKYNSLVLFLFTIFEQVIYHLYKYILKPYILLTTFVVSMPLFIFSQIVVYQDVFRGGITGDAFNPWFNDVSGEFEINIEPNSAIRKAFLFVSVYNFPEERTLIFNGTSIAINHENSMGNEYFFIYNSDIRRIETLIVDVTHLIDPSQNSYPISPPPNQSPPAMGGIYTEFYLYVAYDNPLLDEVCAVVGVNNRQPQAIMNYEFNNLNIMDLNQNTGLAVHASSMCDTIEDGSYVYVDGSLIGLIGGDDDHSEVSCNGVVGSFYYQNGFLFGLGNDVANSTMSGTDAIANIETYLSTNYSIDISFVYQSNWGPQTNPIHQLFLTYTTPCQSFETTLLTSDTTTCIGTPLQLGASGGINYDWLPQTGLSCYDCPNPEFVGDSSMVYTVRIWSTDSCSKVLPVRVKVLPKPEFTSINLTPSACGEENGTIVATASNGTAPYQYQLDGGANVGNGQFNGLASSNYTLTVTDINGCSADSIIIIDEEILVNASFVLEPPSGSAPLWVQSNNTSTNANNYVWTWDDETSTDTHPGFYLDTSGTYTVTLIAYNNFPECADTFSVQVLVYDSLQISIPNVFTPNNDHHNDFFGITTNVPTSGTVVILNRWGNLIMEKDFTTQPHVFEAFWDGMLFGSEKATEGVYFYQLELHTENQEESYHGFVTLVR